MAKKYLTIEEAAELLGVDTSVLSRMREKGEIRAFADRGNWKFREDDVQELVRKRQTDSDPDVPIFKAPETPKDQKHDLGETLMFNEPAGSDSALDLGSEADKNLGEQPTIVRKGGLDDLMGSDSDVRLVFDDSLMPDPITEEAPADLEHSDSDVRLISSGKSSDEGSDSDVKLVPETSAVKTPASGDGSDSDVALIGADKSDIIQLDLDQSDGSFVLGGESSGIALGGAPEDEDDDSGITLDLPNDSGIALDAGDSGISFVSGDSGISLDAGSGISLDADDSSLVLAGDSGISLGGPSDSGIALDASDSKTKNKAKKPKKDDLGGTMPEIPMLAGGDDDMGATTMEVPTFDGQDSEFEFTASPLDDDSSGSVVMLGDDEPAKGGKKKGKKQDSDMFDTGATSEFAADDEFDSNADVFDAEDGSDEMEVAEDIVGEDDEISEDVFGAGDDDFDEELQSGQSSADFVVPAAGGRVSAPVQAEWGGGTFAMLMLSSVVMLLTTFLMYDVVHTMWGNNEPNAGTEMILSSFRGMFG